MYSKLETKQTHTHTHTRTLVQRYNTYMYTKETNEKAFFLTCCCFENMLHICVYIICSCIYVCVYCLHKNQG